MTRNIYALLVGIDNINPIPSLKGCVNDMLNLDMNERQNYLHPHFTDRVDPALNDVIFSPPYEL